MPRPTGPPPDPQRGVQGAAQQLENALKNALDLGPEVRLISFDLGLEVRLISLDLGLEVRLISLDLGPKMRAG